MFLNQYPYLNLNDLNLDFILEAIKEMRNEVTNFVSINAIKYANPIEWDITRQYEKNTIVIDPLTGTAYISVAPVPSGVALTRDEYWTVVFDLSQFIVKAAQNYTTRYEPETTLSATFNTSESEWLVWGDVLYVALRNIAVGELYAVDENIRHITVEEVKNAILTIIGNLDNLKTQNKSDLVSAINELYDNTVWFDCTPYITENTDITDTLTDLINEGFKYLYIPSGSYIINDFELPSGCKIVSDGAFFTSSSNPAITLNSNCEIDGFSIANSNTDSGSNNILVKYDASNVTIRNIGLSGSYIGIYLNHVNHCYMYGISAENPIQNGLCVYANTCNNCVIENSRLVGNYTDGSHTVQFSNGYKNTVRNNDIEQAYNFNIAMTNERNDAVLNNLCQNSRVEAINLDNTDQSEVAGNQCIWNTTYPSVDHGITVYGSTKSANYNSIHHNFVYHCGKAGIAIAGIASSNLIDGNAISGCNTVDTASIMGAITIYKDASDPSTSPFRNKICNNVIVDAPLYLVHEKDGYQNIINNNISFPSRSDYLTSPIYQITNNDYMTEIAPTITPTITGGTLVEHAEYYNGEFIDGEFTITGTANTTITYSLGITPAAFKMFVATVNAGDNIPVTMDALGEISLTPTYTGNVTVAFRYKASKYFA